MFTKFHLERELKMQDITRKIIRIKRHRFIRDRHWNSELRNVQTYVYVFAKDYHQQEDGIYYINGVRLTRNLSLYHGSGEEKCFEATEDEIELIQSDFAKKMMDIYNDPRLML